MAHAICSTHAVGSIDVKGGHNLAGFVLSMGRDMFMAHHRGGFDKDSFLRSSVL